MHKGVILLVKSENKDDVNGLVEEFMEPYGNGTVWDWYVIGGRWSGTLSGKHFKDRDAYKSGGYSDDILPLKECLNIVTQWKDEYFKHKLDNLKKLKKEFNKFDKINLKTLEKNWELRSLLSTCGTSVYDSFSFDCNVFNTHDYDCSIPKDIENYYAVMIDMHN